MMAEDSHLSPIICINKYTVLCGYSLNKPHAKNPERINKPKDSFRIFVPPSYMETLLPRPLHVLPRIISFPL